MSIADIEAAETTSGKEGSATPIPFGHLHDEWVRLKKQQRAGEYFVRLGYDKEKAQRRDFTAGYALVEGQGQCVVGTLIGRVLD